MPASKLDLVPGGAAGALDGADRFPVVQGTVAATNEDANGAIKVGLLSALATWIQTTLGLTTSSSPQFAGVNLGHASDTTLTRVSAGLMAVEGGNVPLENRANTFSQQQVITLSSVGATPLVLISTEGGAAAGPVFETRRDGGSVANGDDLSSWRMTVRDDGGTLFTAVEFRGQVTDVAAASKDSGFQFYNTQANSPVREWQVRDGTIFGNPTGGHKGTGTLNAGTVYDDNTTLTCMALQVEFFEHGAIDLAKWDALVPDIIVPEVARREPVMELVPVWDADGNGISAIEEPATELVERTVVRRAADGYVASVEEVAEPVVRTVVTPARTVRRRHETAHRFAAMIADGFDPRRPAAYVARLKADQSLPGMPTQADWQHNALSTGELFCRLWLATEMLALVVVSHEERLAALEARPRGR